MRWFGSLLLAGLSLLVGCSGTDEAVGDDGRGPDTCANYRDALCDWVARCNPGVAYADCQATASAIVCVEDGRAEACTTAIDIASCAEPPDDCELFDVADRAPARRACEQYSAAVCAGRVACETQSLADCEAELAALDCASIVGVKSSFDACIAALEAVSCDPSPPPSCEDILLSEPQLP